MTIESSAVPMRSVLIRTRRACSGTGPSELPYQRYELGAPAVFDLRPGSRARHARQSLLPLGANRDDHPAAAGKLLDERLRHRRRGGGDDDAIERRLVRPAVRPVEDFDRGVVDLQL